MTTILNSKKIKDSITNELKERCDFLIKNGIQPFLKVLLVGNNPASLVYTSHKKKHSESIGAKCEIVTLSNEISEKDFLNEVSKINLDSKVQGCIIQLPLPKHLNHLDVSRLIHKEKDVDGFHPENIFAVMSNTVSKKDFVSCTPKGIITLLQKNQIEIKNKNVVIVGRSMIVGKPLACLFTNLDATVTLAHSKTKNLQEITKNCDILVSAIGRPNFITKDFISSKKNQIIIDVGINKDKNNAICGDVDFENVKDLTMAITPVPGGVGPMTIISLMDNLLLACENHLEARI